MTRPSGSDLIAHLIGRNLSRGYGGCWMKRKPGQRSLAGLLYSDRPADHFPIVIRDGAT